MSMYIIYNIVVCVVKNVYFKHKKGKRIDDDELKHIFDL